MSKFKRGDYVLAKFSLPSDPVGLETEHPILIISPEDTFHIDESYLGVMLTHRSYVDRFTFEIKPNMLVNGGDGSYIQARCHLVTYIFDSFLRSHRILDHMKSEYVDQLVEHIHNSAMLEH